MEELRKKFDEALDITGDKKINSLDITRFIMLVMKNVKEDGLTLKALFDTIYETLTLILQNDKGDQKDEIGTPNN